MRPPMFIGLIGLSVSRIYAYVYNPTRYGRVPQLPSYSASGERHSVFDIISGQPAWFLLTRSAQVGLTLKPTVLWCFVRLETMSCKISTD